MTTTERRVVEHATCLGCGCLCDDIALSVEAGRVVEAGRACATIGVPWFLAPRPGEGCPPATIDGRQVDVDRAIGRAVEILGSARSPLIRGLAGSTIEAIREALAIADRVGAVVDLDRPRFVSDVLDAYQRVGQVSATLGEVKDRADVVVFWGVDPLTTHPRHLERYSNTPTPRLIAPGRTRTLIVIDHRPTPTAAASDLCIHVAPDRHGETLWTLRALVRGLEIDPDRAEGSTGVPFPALLDLADRLRGARYGAFFLGPSLDSRRAVEAALCLVRDLNDGRRFVALTLGEAGNAAGAGSILAWQAGAPGAIDLGGGFPRYLPGDATWDERSRLGEVDALLVLGERPGGSSSIPTIRIAPGATRPGDDPPAVAFDVARPGIESGGTVERVDGVMLPLRPPLRIELPGDREILAAIRQRLST